MKILVLENVSSLDLELSRYISLIKEKNDIEILHGFERAVSQEELLSKILESEYLLIQSTFSNQDQLLRMLKLIQLASTKKKITIKVIYTHDKFLIKLNTDFEIEVRELISYLISKNCIDLYEILYKKWEINKATNIYFKDIEVDFCECKIYYNSQYHLLWHEKKPSFKDPYDFLYKSGNNNSSLSHCIVKLNNKEIRCLQNILNEMNHFNNDRLEDLIDNDYSKKLILSEEERKSLLKERKEKKTF